MSTFTALAPGAIVRSIENVIGVIERLESIENADHEENALIVRDQEGSLYRFPVVLIDTVSTSTQPPVVTLQLHHDLVRVYQARDINDGSVGELLDETTTRHTENELTRTSYPAEQTSSLEIPTLAEHLIVSTHPISLGEVHIHKGVTASEQSLTVPLYREDAVIEHIAVDQYDPQGIYNPNELVIPILEERLVVSKRTVVTEYVRIRKHTVTRQEERYDTIRREYITVNKQP